MSREFYTLDDLRDWPSATAEHRPPLRLAVFGDPVAHSASPPMHNAALAAAGIDARYTRLHVGAASLAEALELAARQGFIGVNLTILPAISPPPYAEYRQAIVESGVKIVERAGSNPKDHLPVFHEAGIKVIHKCTSVRHAIKAEQLGVPVLDEDQFTALLEKGPDGLV